MMLERVTKSSRIFDIYKKKRKGFYQQKEERDAVVEPGNCRRKNKAPRSLD